MVRWRLDSITDGDLESILSIEQISFRRPWGRSSFESELKYPKARNFIVRSDDGATPAQVVAYVFLRLITVELHLLKIAVTPACRGYGLATWLLTECFKMGEDSGAETVYLEVRTSNIAAVGLYQKLGFVIIGRRPKYYTDTSEDALVMIKNLKEAL
jgi:[ribosomal protein S18]-alanine N-acetyltransferase